MSQNTGLGVKSKMQSSNLTYDSHSLFAFLTDNEIHRTRQLQTHKGRTDLCEDITDLVTEQLL